MVHAEKLTGHYEQVVVGGAGRKPRVFPRAAHGEMVKALEGIVRKAHQFMHGIIEEKVGRSPVALTPWASASGSRYLPDHAGFPKQMAIATGCGLKLLPKPRDHAQGESAVASNGLPGKPADDAML